MKTAHPSLLPALVAAVLIAAAGIAFAETAQADGKPLETALKNLASFKGAIDSEAYWKFREEVLKLRNDPTGRPPAEKALLAFLKTSAPLPAKMAVCRELRILGGPASIPVLEGFLTDKDMSDPARYALEDIPEEEADLALMRALDKTSGNLRLGIIQALGFRKYPEAAGPLGKILAGKNETEAVAAAYALGRIGGKTAMAGFVRALGSPSAIIKKAAMSAILAWAEGPSGLNDPAALPAIDAILAAKPDAAIRRAATRAKISASGEKARAALVGLLRSDDEVVQEAAIGKIKDVFPAGDIGQITPLLTGLPEGSRVKLIAVLAEYPGKLVLPAVRDRVKSSSQPERIAVLKALAFVGDPSVVPVLAEAAAGSSGEEQAAARASLGWVKGRDFDEAVLARLDSGAPEAVKSELIQAVGERRIFSGKSVLLGQLSGASIPLRIQALKVLKVIGTPSDIPSLLNHLARAGDETEREEIESAAAALALKIAQPIGRSDIVKARLRTERDPARRAGLIRILAKIGDDSALPLLRQNLMSSEATVKDAAIRAISDWPTAAPVEDVYEIAKKAEGETHRLLALRAFIRLTALSKYRIPENAVSDLRLALEMSRRPEEKRLALAALPDFACPDALRLARSFLNDPDLQAEAKAAVTAIEERLK